jgi:hypothetical protein
MRERQVCRKLEAYATEQGTNRPWTKGCKNSMIGKRIRRPEMAIGRIVPLPKDPRRNNLNNSTRNTDPR